MYKILHIDTERTWRGGQQQVLSLMEGLTERGHENLAVVYRESPLAEKLKGRWDVMEVRPFAEWDFIAAHYVNRKIKSAGIDIVHAHSAHGVALAALSVLGTNVPYVLTRRVDFSIGRNFFSRWKYRGASGTAAISNKVKDVLLQSGMVPEKIFLIPSGVNFKKYLDAVPVSKKNLGFPDDALVVGQVAALAPHKDQKTFLSAIKRLKQSEPRVRGIIVGEGPSRSDIEAEIRRLGLTSEVRLTGYQKRPLDYLLAFDVFCLSSKEEGLGTSLIDAMALRIPVVATRAGGIPDLIEHQKTGFLAVSGDSEALAQSLREALLGGNNKEKMLSEAFEKAKNFDISRTIEGTEAMYQVVLQNKK